MKSSWKALIWVALILIVGGAAVFLVGAFLHTPQQNLLPEDIWVWVSTQLGNSVAIVLDPSNPQPERVSAAGVRVFYMGLILLVIGLILWPFSHKPTVAPAPAPPAA